MVTERRGFKLPQQLYRKLPAHKGAPSCMMFLRDDPFAGEPRVCGRPSTTVVKREGYLGHLYLCAECEKVWH